MKALFLIACLCGSLIGFAQTNSPIFEKYIDIFEGDIRYACNYPLFLTSVNEVELDIEPIAYDIKGRMIVVGFAVFIPPHVEWSKKKPKLILELQDNKEVELPVILFDREDYICYFQFTPELKRQLESAPISRIILKNNTHKLTSKELSARQSTYFIELIDQEFYQIYIPVDWSYPYYYD